LTVAADAPPVSVCVVARTCLISSDVIEKPLIATVGAITTPFREKVNVAGLDVVLVTTIFVITVDVEAGTVYKVVFVLVVAAPLKRTFAVLAI
jgi:hypothetical protein